MKSLTIGQLAQRAQVNIETIRYYERRGLMPEPPRLESGYRQYCQDHVARIQFIRRAKELGFSLKEILGLLSLRVDPSTTCGDVKRKAEAKIVDIEEKIRDLQRMREALARLVASCKGDGPSSECPILEALDTKWEG
jgi:MerR family mercuric resistance operon transcriptional regulator